MNECTYGNLEAVEMAIKALEQEPCEDAISRQVVDDLSKELVHTTRDKADFLCNFWEGLQKLPSVTSQPKTVYWTPISEGYPPIEDKYKDFLVTDDKGEITVQKLYFTIDIKRQPYFSGMVNPVAWMPSPLPYKVESEVK
jgi:hypothetical protein